jgi:hypothetical protein
MATVAPKKPWSQAVETDQSVALRGVSWADETVGPRLPVSRTFPFLSADELLDWVQRAPTGPETDWMCDAEQWVRDLIVPRYRNANP